MRITNNMIFQRSLADIDASRTKLAEVQRQISSGKRIQVASDDPTAFEQSQRARREIAELDGYLETIGAGKAFLQETETTLDAFQDVMLQLQDRIIQAAGGGLTGEALDNYKREIVELRENLRQLANTRDGQGRYLFGGWKTTPPDATAPYPTDLSTGSNSEKALQIEVARGVQLDMSLKGDLFIGETVPVGTGGVPGVPAGPVEPDLFRAIDRFVATLGKNPNTSFERMIDSTTSPPATVRTTFAEEQAEMMTSIQKRTKAVISSRTLVAERIQRLETYETLYDERVRLLTGRIDTLEETDLPTASLTFARYDAQFKAALSVSARTLPTSLVDYLR